MGEAFGLDSIVNSIDAEVVAKGDSDKGPNRGAIICHGSYTLWGYSGGVAMMTPAGQALFINTVHYAAGRRGRPVLEYRRNKTRDGLYSYLAAARTRAPGLLRTVQRYLPPAGQGKSIAATAAWLDANRAWFYLQGRQFQVDTYAKNTGIPNHQLAFLTRCIADLNHEQKKAAAHQALGRYTGLELGTAPEPWTKWLDRNRPYLFFSDCDGFRFKLDAAARAKKIPTAELRDWSSETINYRVDQPPPADPVATFVAAHAAINGKPDMNTVHSLVRTITDNRLFTRVERRTMRDWHRNPRTREGWEARRKKIENSLGELETTHLNRLLSGEEMQRLRRLRRTRQVMERRNAAWLAVYAAANPADYPFILTPRKALALRVIDGCTSSSRLFCLLAHTAGLQVRPLGASDLDALKKIWQPGRERGTGNVNGHKMALVKITGRWHLVNSNHFVPAATPPYEIFSELHGSPLDPATLPGKILRLPSMQVADGRRSPRLVITQVGPLGTTDLGEYSLAANLNLAVSGQPSSPLCRHPALTAILSQ